MSEKRKTFLQLKEPMLSMLSSELRRRYQEYVTECRRLEAKGKELVKAIQTFWYVQYGEQGMWLSFKLLGGAVYYRYLKRKPQALASLTNVVVMPERRNAVVKQAKPRSPAKAVIFKRSSNG